MTNPALVTEKQLLREIENVAREMGVSPATVTLRAVNNSRLPRRLAEGATVSLDTARRILEFIAAERADRQITNA
jgi:DNA-binding LacI/PurR family transcriptional regulator